MLGAPLVLPLLPKHTFTLQGSAIYINRGLVLFSSESGAGKSALPAISMRMQAVIGNALFMTACWLAYAKATPPRNASSLAQDTG